MPMGQVLSKHCCLVHPGLGRHDLKEDGVFLTGSVHHRHSLLAMPCSFTFISFALIDYNFRLNSEGPTGPNILLLHIGETEAWRRLRIAQPAVVQRSAPLRSSSLGTVNVPAQRGSYPTLQGDIEPGLGIS